MAARNELVGAFLKGQEQMTGSRLHLTKQFKEDVFFTIIPDGARQCVKCVHFQKVPGTKDGSGTCDNVNGIIPPDAHCDDWVQS